MSRIGGQRYTLHRVRDTATYIRSAVHVPLHSAPRQVPEPEVPLSRPKPTARLMPVLKVTLMLPASATRPDAVTAALVDAICPLLIPIATVAPLPQVSLEDEIRTFQAPSKLVDAAFACPQSRAMAEIAAKIPLQGSRMTRPIG
ncbi:hypothetical protein [Bradyrhizobium ottawaense]|uniref:hypothetical protein n=1 Tax=Bradyrhizobium ottawaense TaxID=931866 RepID=UPI001BA462E1|nr:hypothetical protein [Bradyrhizobium ottawaense]MBR1362981.1 hypothetical protein [Bradyrhizobium ottawaense]